MPITHIEEKRLTAGQKVDRCIELMAEVEILLGSMKFEYADHRGNIEEAIEYAEYISTNLQGHKKDIQQGKE